MMILSTSISVRARRSTADRSSQAGDGERDQGQPVPTRLWLVVKLDNILVARFPLRNGIEPSCLAMDYLCALAVSQVQILLPRPQIALSDAYSDSQSHRSATRPGRA
jgi:hypothetical protein